MKTKELKTQTAEHYRCHLTCELPFWLLNLHLEFPSWCSQPERMYAYRRIHWVDRSVNTLQIKSGLLEITLTSPESGFATPVAGGRGSHNSAWKYTFAWAIPIFNSNYLNQKHYSKGLNNYDLLPSPSHGYRFGCAVTGYQGNESRDVGVLQKRKHKRRKKKIRSTCVYVCVCVIVAAGKRTRMMMRIADTPEVAITLAQLGMRLNRTGTIASAPWSNLFPSTVDMWLQENRNHNHTSFGVYFYS